jgi:hypothetical protein
VRHQRAATTYADQIVEARVEPLHRFHASALSEGPTYGVTRPSCEPQRSAMRGADGQSNRYEESFSIILGADLAHSMRSSSRWKQVCSAW